ncbi:MAG TPA: DUF523 and DUF1722 domain-containing protein [Vicinamibacterales bacterium]
MTQLKLRVGVSSCLLGRPVRYDGGHKRDDFLNDVLGPFVEWVPACPEVDIGLGTPRPAIRLEGSAAEPRLIMPSTGADLTDRMRRYAEGRVAALAREDLCGYVLKKSSPSCGMERVKVYAANGQAAKKGRGIFADVLMDRMPALPVEEEGRLVDPVLRENFIERLFAYRRLKDFFTGRWTPGGLVAFHTAHKFALLAHSTAAYQRLGRFVAAGASLGRAALRAGYEEQFMAALSTPATPKKHANVLMHMAGHFKGRLDAASRGELLGVIDEYRRGLLPLVVPITLIRHHVRAHEVAYLAGQIYLEPHPRELMLRNHV